ncbi:MAG: hypothetical protein AAF364_18650 [Pseudomonadota bacterium]
MPLKTIKQVRGDLRAWGNFWAKAELGQGYARQSVTARICEIMRTQVQISSDLHLFSHQADNFYVPPHIDEIGKAIDRLSLSCRTAIKDKYIKRKVRDDYYIREAENTLIAFL